MLHITVNQGDGPPLYVQIVRQMKHIIATGRLKPHDEVPPVRVLAQQLCINPNTVARAYRELEMAGLLYKRWGAGTYVAEAGVPYSEEECRRILAERADALLIEGRNLGYDLNRVIGLLRERDKALGPRSQGKQGGPHDGSK